MKELQYTIRTMSPLTIAEKNNDGTLCSTKSYIPGSAVRAYFIEQYSRDHGCDSSDATFQKLFFKKKVRYLPAYPVHEVVGTKAQALPIPASLMKNKFDNSITDMASGDDIKLGVGDKKWNGFLNKVGTELYPVSVATQAHVHIQRTEGRLRLIGRSDDGAIFNQEYIEPGQSFQGRILVDDDVADAVQAMVKANSGHMYLGRSRHAEYGSCTCSFQEMTGASTAVPELGGSYYLLALSPYVPNYEWQDVSTILDQLVAELSGKLKAKGLDCTVSYDYKHVWMQRVEINGYMTVWQARHERVYGMSAGSMFGLEISPCTKDVLSQVQACLQEGLGQRVDDGYGQFLVWQASKDWTVRTAEAAAVDVGNLSDVVKERARRIVVEKAKSELSMKASREHLYGPVSNHQYKRLELLMGSNLSRAEIRKEIREVWRDGGQKSLQARWICDNGREWTVWNLLFEEAGAPARYLNIPWADRFGISEEDLKELCKTLDLPATILDEDTAYRTYWFWLARHAMKESKGGE